MHSTACEDVDAITCVNSMIDLLCGSLLGPTKRPRWGIQITHRMASEACVERWNLLQQFAAQ